jgi:serine/threonine protein kinase
MMPLLSPDQQEDAIRHVVRQLVCALAYLQEHQVIHSDL